MIQENKAKQEALCAFLNSDYKEAIRIALKYLNEIGHGPVSLGDHMKMGGPPPAEFLAYFRTVRPAILASMPNELFEVLRIEAALEELFGEQDRRKWVTGERFVPFERQFAKNMISFAAGHLYKFHIG